MLSPVLSLTIFLLGNTALNSSALLVVPSSLLNIALHRYCTFKTCSGKVARGFKWRIGRCGIYIIVTVIQWSWWLGIISSSLTLLFHTFVVTDYSCGAQCYSSEHGSRAVCPQWACFLCSFSYFANTEHAVQFSKKRGKHVNTDIQSSNTFPEKLKWKVER